MYNDAASEQLAAVETSMKSGPLKLRVLWLFGVM